MDWNYFFSAFAQSGAAIIGIFGAFTITKIVAEEQTYDNVDFETNCYLDETNKEYRKRLVNELKMIVHSHKQTYKPLRVFIYFMMCGVLPLVVLPLYCLPVNPNTSWIEEALSIQLPASNFGIKLFFIISLFVFSELFFTYFLFRLSGLKKKYSELEAVLDIAGREGTK